ncbi:MAG: 3-dehydroquinate synthase [Pseudomonadota bacterium]
MPQQVEIDLGERSYPVIIGDGLLEQEDLLRPYLSERQVVVVTNTVVAPLYLDALRPLLAPAAIDVFTMPDGEAHKSLAVFESIMGFLLEHRHSRSTTLVALGGGVVGDMTGFVAACYQRGVDFVQIPTTLLAQVDSSVGGKTAVNHPLGKNMIGAFYQPRAVLADAAVLRSLPTREYAAGLAEVVKYGIIDDLAFFEWLEGVADALADREPAAIAQAVRRSVENKARVVAADEREGGIRAILNFGHTFGHAIETLTGYQTWLHGEAVALGMVQAAMLSARLGLCDAAAVGRIGRLLQRLGLPVAPPELDPQAMVDTMGLDKKVQDGKLRLVLLHGLGQVAVHSDVPAPVLMDVLTNGSTQLRAFGLDPVDAGGIR